MIQKTFRKRFLVLIGIFLLVGAGLYLDGRQPATHIKDQAVGQKSLATGRVTSGKNVAHDGALATDSRLAFESPELKTGLPRANAVGFNWVQTGNGTAEIEARTNDGNGWSDWLELEGGMDKPDFVKPTAHSAMLLTKDAKQTQYRFSLKGKVRVADLRVNAVDATTGPNPAKRTIVSRLFGNRASAISNPRIYSRAEWGSPEAGGSPRWTPRYWKPERVMVHHTVSNATTSFAGSAANVRAIWYQHANTNGWGDIGYNYLVDQSGHIFQGRYYDKTFATNNKVEVEAGHTYSFNDRSIGIAALGNFQNVNPSNALLDNIGKIAGFKIAPYKLGAKSAYMDEGVSASASSGCPPARGRRSQYRIAGHRNYCSTACPGNNLYARLGTIRNVAQVYRDAYVAQMAWDYSFVGKSQHAVSLVPGGTTAIYIDLKNEGDNTWHNSGSPIVRLGTDRPQDRHSRFSATWISPSRAATFEDQSGGGGDADVHTIQPGETARFSFTATAPSTPGTYKEYFRPVADGSGWFYRDLGINWALTVVPPRAFQIQKTVYSGNQSAFAHASTMNAQVAVKNTGSLTWSSTGPNPVRFATSNPHDRSSAFRTMSGVDPWLSANRASAIDGTVTDVGSMTVDANDKTIEPGQTALFTVYLTANKARGTYREFFNLVQEGVGWFPDPGYNMKLTVVP